MALYPGTLGKITVGSKDVCAATFSVEISAAIAEKACLGAEWKEKAAGIKEWTATADGVADFTDDGQAELVEAMESGEPVACVFYLADTAYFSGSGVIESLSITHDAEGQAEISANIVGNGALTSTTP